MATGATQTLISHAPLGNAGTRIVFRLGAEDASVLAKVFQPSFTAHDQMNVANREIYLRLLIDGALSKPFSAETICAEL